MDCPQLPIWRIQGVDMKKGTCSHRQRLDHAPGPDPAHVLSGVSVNVTAAAQGVEVWRKKGDFGQDFGGNWLSSASFLADIQWRVGIGTALGYPVLLSNSCRYSNKLTISGGWILRYRRIRFFHPCLFSFDACKSPCNISSKPPRCSPHPDGGGSKNMDLAGRGPQLFP